jgi:hypothetical protein
MRNVSNKSCRENQNTYFMFRSVSENRVIYEVMSKNSAKQETPLAIWRIQVHYISTKAHRPTHEFTDVVTCRTYTRKARPPPYYVRLLAGAAENKTSRNLTGKQQHL